MHEYLTYEEKLSEKYEVYEHIWQLDNEALCSVWNLKQQSW